MCAFYLSDLGGQLYVYGVYVHMWDTGSALRLAAPGGMELWQPHLCWTTGFNSSQHLPSPFRCP